MFCYLRPGHSRLRLGDGGGTSGSGRWLGMLVPGCEHVERYQMVWEPEMADATHSLRIRTAYFLPMRRLCNTSSLGGNQLPKLPTTKGRTSTLSKRPRRGVHIFCFSCAASCKASGLPSNGMHTSTSNAERPSGASMVRSGRFAPVVLGNGCSLNLSPIDGGIARISLSRTAFPD